MSAGDATQRIPGVLVLYHHPVGASAPTIMEHAGAFARYSKFPVWMVNTELGFPAVLNGLGFDCIVLHYSLFGSAPFALDARFWSYLRQRGGARLVAFFQDEHQHCQARFRLVDELGVDCIFSLFEPHEYDKVYLRHTACKRIRHTLTGFVDDGLIELARRLEVPYRERTTDIGYRARDLAYVCGHGGQEKSAIGREVLRRLEGSGLELDIATNAQSRIYGEDWYRFVANCRAVLGVEAGVSIVDIDGEVARRCELLLREHPQASFALASERVLADYEDKIFYRTISPRIFEAAALRTCMILFEGRYNDLLRPMEHYIPLRKDYSNLEWAIGVLRDEVQRERITTRAYDDLIASGKLNYRNFVAEFDRELEDLGLSPARANAFASSARAQVSEALATEAGHRETAILRRRRTMRIVRMCIPQWAPVQKMLSAARSWRESRRWRREVSN